MNIEDTFDMFIPNNCIIAHLQSNRHISQVFLASKNDESLNCSLNTRSMYASTWLKDKWAMLCRLSVTSWQHILILNRIKSHIVLPIHIFVLPVRKNTYNRPVTFFSVPIGSKKISLLALLFASLPAFWSLVTIVCQF